MKISHDKAYSYKDIVLQPAYSQIESRSKLDASVEFLCTA